jgi:MtN3 and saliva related transmembrane protein
MQPWQRSWWLAGWASDEVPLHVRCNTSPVVLALSMTAALLTTGAFIPQMLRALRTRSTGDLSWGYLALFGTGVGLWLVYGLIKGDPALIVANGFTFVMVGVISAAKVSHRTPR